jgi:AraC-like DNA-binding protein
LPFALGLLWPLRYLPPVTLGGVFPMTVPGCNGTYAGPIVALHLHDYSGDFWIARQRYRLEPGDITLSPPDVPSRYDLKESGTHLCLHFQPPDSAARATSLRLPLHIRLGPQTAAARERFWRTIDHVRQAGGRIDSPSASAASASLQELLLWLQVQSHRGQAPGRSSLMEEAIQKLEAAIEKSLSKPMLIGELAAGVGLSSDYVARLFASRYGMTLQHYLLLRRIELARHLLVSSDLPVSDIGNQVGIPDPQYFNKQFRRVTGQSPLAYRLKQIAKQSRKAKSAKPSRQRYRNATRKGRKTASVSSR